MPYEPSPESTLLRRHVVSTTSNGALQIREYYYEPSLRDSRFIDFLSSDDGEYTLSTAVIVDRWCTAIGVAPYTEARVHRSGGMGAIAIDYADNVTSCQLICALGVTLTAGPVHNGRADLTATLRGATGAVLLSLDGFQTPGTPPETATTATFLDARPGTYTISARETRAGGCTATATLTFTAPYGPRYEVSFKDLDSTACLLRVWEREYGGAVEELTAQEEAVVLDWPGGATDHLFTQLLNGSECQLALYLMRDEQLLPLFSGDERLHRVDYHRAGVLRWTGYLLPEQYDAAFLTPPSVFNLAASDGLGTLSTTPFVGSAGEALRGDWTALRVLRFCLDKLDLALPLRTLFTLFPAGALTSRPALEQFAVDVAAYQDDKGKAWDCGRVLLELLKPFAARLYQQDGAWWLERLSELTGGDTTYTAYAADGTRAADVTVNRLMEVSGPPTTPHWLNGGQRQGLRPAVGTVTVTPDESEPTNLLRFALPAVTDLPAPWPASWTGASATPATPWAQLLYDGKDKAPKLRLLGTPGPLFGYPSLAAGFAAAALAPWVQTPVSPPLPLPFRQGGGHDDETLVLKFTATPFGITPNELSGQHSFLVVGLHFGNAWLRGQSGGADSPVTPVVVSAADFTTDQEVTVEVPFGGTQQLGAQPLYVRFYAPVGGASAPTVDLTDIRLEYATRTPEIDDAYTSSYTGNTGQLVSRVDTAAAVFHADTRHVRHPGTWLEPTGRPVQGWYEAPGQLREVGDYLVRDRLRWQAVPAQALAGTLRGQLPGPGTLLTDPSEIRPAVYVLTTCQHRAASAEWEVTAVQDVLLTPPVARLPDNAIYNDDLTAWQDEDGRILVYENG